MTTLYHEKKRCAVCGAQHEYTSIGSTNAFGSPDLDTRPPEMQRSTIFAWVQRCPKCGFCASNISKASDQAISVIRSEAYHEQLSDPSMPELANSFLCKSIIDETAGDYGSAAWSLIHAAWVCDDEAIWSYYRKWGIVLVKTNGDERYKVPVPATYVIDSNGVSFP